jgi:hypothetical protein
MFYAGDFMSEKFSRFALRLVTGALLTSLITFAASTSLSIERNKKENDSTTDSTDLLASPTSATQTSARSRFTGTFYYRNMFAKSSFNDLTGAPTVFSFGQLGYRLTSSKTVLVRQEVNYQYWGDTKNPQKLSPSDIFFAYTDSDLAPLKYDYKLTGSFRLYLPTGDASRFVTKQNGGAMAWFILSKSSGKFDWDFHLFNIYYNETQNSYVDSTGTVQPNALYEIDPAFDIAYNINPHFAITGWLQSENITNKPVDGLVRDQRHFIIEPGVVFHPVKDVSIAATYFDYMDTSTISAAHPFMDKDCQYRLTFIGTL